MSIYASLLAVEEESETKLVPLKIFTKEITHTAESLLTDHVVKHSWRIQITDMRLYPFPVSSHPHLYRITIPATKDAPSHYFYVLFSHHMFPIELVMPKRTLVQLMNECSFVVGEISEERGGNLSKKILAKHGLLLDDTARKKLVDAQRKSINDTLGNAPSSVCESILGEYKTWLDNWYYAISEFLRNQLENNKDLLVTPELLQKMHPFLVINKIKKDLSPNIIADKKAEKFGMDTAIENLCRQQGKSYYGLETLRDRLDTGGLQELSKDVQYFMKKSSTPIVHLQIMVAQMPKDASELPVDINPNQRPYWATYESEFIEVKTKRETDIRDYFNGKYPSDRPSKSAIKSTKNWQPKIMKFASEQLRPWLLNPGLQHHEILNWFRRCHIERLSN